MHADRVTHDMSTAMNRTKSVAVYACTSVAMATLVLLFLAGVMDSRSFAVDGLAVITLAAIIWFLLLRHERARTDGFGPTTVTDSQSRDKAKYVRVAIISLWLVVSLWVTRAGPWLPRLVGAFVLVLLLIAAVRRKSTNAKF